jgi:hypothetical protein
MKSEPDGAFIDNMHKDWWGNYATLETHHSYIQWLFPIREQGLNPRAQRLLPHEARTISEDPSCRKRLIRSYEMILDFFGIRMTDRSTGELERAPHWKHRYRNLNRMTHNYLRITRILKCLGELGFEHYKIHLVKHFLREIAINGQLKKLLRSCCHYWIEVLKNPSERQRMRDLAQAVCRPRAHMHSEFQGKSERAEKRTNGSKGLSSSPFTAARRGQKGKTGKHRTNGMGPRDRSPKKPRRGPGAMAG